MVTHVQNLLQFACQTQQTSHCAVGHDRGIMQHLIHHTLCTECYDTVPPYGKRPMTHQIPGSFRILRHTSHDKEAPVQWRQNLPFFLICLPCSQKPLQPCLMHLLDQVTKSDVIPNTHFNDCLLICSSLAQPGKYLSHTLEETLSHRKRQAA